jgi:hypothetical protein
MRVRLIETDDRPCRQEVNGVKIEAYCRLTDEASPGWIAVDIEIRAVGER